MTPSMRAMLQKVQNGDQPKVGVVTKAQIRAAGNALRALMAADLLTMTEPFIYALTEKGRKALEKK